jgi:hypothetical protein
MSAGICCQWNLCKSKQSYDGYDKPTKSGNNGGKILQLNTLLENNVYKPAVDLKKL